MRRVLPFRFTTLSKLHRQITLASYIILQVIRYVLAQGSGSFQADTIDALHDDVL
jgi:hypothetical protein